jgi:hypothetical protein
MTTIVFAIMILAIMIAIVIFFFKPYDYGKEEARHEGIRVGSQDPVDPSADTRSRLVRIRPGLMACKQATAIGEQIFLSRDAPRLPLVNCSETDCRCHYIFQEDRRSGLDRRAELDRLGRLLLGEGEDRRRSPGRRVGDPATA